MFGSRITLGSLTMYVSSAITFSSTIIQFGENLIGLWQNSQFLVPYQEFMALKEETIEDGGVPMDDIVETLEFRNVSFTYPKAEKPVLKNVSFAVKKGEKISIVGLNGETSLKSKVTPPLFRNKHLFDFVNYILP